MLQLQNITLFECELFMETYNMTTKLDMKTWRDVKT